MGTHISKVKSVDLDIWTPEQMESIKKWGNHRANLYWEAHLKPGHIPADHKMESFIRSKYESRRWAMDGPPPADPSILEAPAASVEQAVQQIVTASPPAPLRSSSTAVSVLPALPGMQGLSRLNPPTAPSRPVQEPAVVPILADNAVATPKKPLDDLFSLDFRSPPPPMTEAREPKTAKSDILSLFDKAPPSLPLSAAVQLPAITSLANQGGAAMWGVQSNFPTVSQTNPWGPPPPQLNVPFGADIWSNGSNARQAAGGPSELNVENGGTGQRAADAFSDLWGDFK